MTVNPKFKVHGEKGVGCGRYVRCTETLLPGIIKLLLNALSQAEFCRRTDIRRRCFGIRT